MLVRRIKALKSLPGYFEEGDIHIEYGDNPEVFYQEKYGPNENGIGLSLLVIRPHFNEFFEELDPVPFKQTDRFEQVHENLNHELDEINVQIVHLVDRKEFIEKLLN